MPDAQLAAQRLSKRRRADRESGMHDSMRETPATVAHSPICKLRSHRYAHGAERASTFGFWHLRVSAFIAVIVRKRDEGVASREV